MAAVGAWASVPADFLTQTTVASDLIIAKMEEYLIKVFGYPKAFLMVLAKASFGRQPIPIVNCELFITKTWKFLKEMEDIINVLSPVSSEVTVATGNPTFYHHKGTQTEDKEKGDSLVQITASTEEINRRINSFIHRKRLEVDAYNRREFCVFKSSKDESTCARADAAFVPRHGKKSLLKTYKVYNKLDTTRTPHSKQTSSRLKGLSNAWRPTHPSTSLDLKHLPVETYERVDNLHQHVFAKPLQKPNEDEKQASHSAFEKIKSLEDRVLLLEGLSPEYFGHNNKEIHYREAKDLERTWQTDFNQQTSKDAVLMDKRINELRGILQSKSNP